MIARSSTDPFDLAIDLIAADRAAASDRSAALVAAHGAARRSRRGRPQIDGIGAFGVSHSGRWTAYLVANRKYAGIDLELRDRPDLAGLEQRLGRAVAGADEIDVDFLTRWVLKEACLKALGLGLLSLGHVRLKDGCHPDPRQGQRRAFAAAVGRIGMVATVMDLGFALLALAYRDCYDPPSLQLHIDDNRR